jgi:hypothetical protein
MITFILLGILKFEGSLNMDWGQISLISLGDVILRMSLMSYIDGKRKE